MTGDAPENGDVASGDGTGARDDRTDGQAHDEQTDDAGQTIVSETVGTAVDELTGHTWRWRGGVGAIAVLATAGLVFGSRSLYLAALLPAAYLAAGAMSSPSVPTDLVVRRTITPAPAPPGHPVRVTLTVHNESDRTIADCRVVDGVPDDLAVTRGSPRAGGTLSPGETVTVEYELIARRGEHAFGDPTVRVRGLSAAAVATRTFTPAGDREFVCKLDAEAPPLADQADRRVGQLATESPGRGIEFHSTREYRHGDDAKRIHWRQYAKRGELATVNYEQRRAASVLMVIDARAQARIVPGPGRPSAVELAGYAASHAVREFLASGHDVAVAVVGLDGPGPSGLFWLPPGGGADHRSRAQDLLEIAADGGPEGPDPRTQFHELAAIADPSAQIALFSPMIDDVPVEAVETWRAQDHPVVVLSPDVVTANTVSGEYAQVRRRTRLAHCQATGSRAIDWRRGTPLPFVLEYAFASELRRPGAPARGHGVGGGD